MTEKLYLQERIDIMGAHENRARFAEVLVQLGQAQPEGAPWQQIGVWILIGMTGRWQRTLGLWEWADGWEGFSAAVESQMIRPEPALAHTYENVEGLRSGGECFLMNPGSGCPTRADLVKLGVKGSLLIYERATVAPGSEEEFCEAVRSQFAPVAEGHGYRLVGNYTAAMVDGLVFTLWTCERHQHTALARSAEAVEWRSARQKWTTSWQQELWVAAAGSPLAGSETARKF